MDMIPPVKRAGVGLAVAFHQIDGPMRECFAGCSLCQPEQSEWPNLSFSFETKGIAMTKCAGSYRDSGQFPHGACVRTRLLFPAVSFREERASTPCWGARSVFLGTQAA